MSKGKQPYIPLYIGDWEQDTNCISVAAEGAWLKIVFKMFKGDKSGIYKTSTNGLQNLWKIHSIDGIYAIFTELKLHDVCGLVVENTPENVEIVTFTNRRMVHENEVSTVRKKAVSKRYGKSGTKGVTKRLQKSKNGSTKALHPYESEYDINTVLNNIDNSIEFDVFWDEYDKKVGDKKKLIKVWKGFPPAVQQKILDYLPGYKKAQPDKKYRKDPQTFFNNSSWNDELIFSNNGTNQQTHPAAGQSGTSTERVNALKAW